MNIQRWLWGVFSLVVCLALVTLFLAVERVRESGWWQHLNTRYSSLGIAIEVPSFDRTAHYNSQMLWKREDNGQLTVVHGIIVSNEIHSRYTASSTNPTQQPTDFRSLQAGVPEDTTTMVSIPQGLYVNGKKLSTSGNVRIFVLDKESVAHPIELTPAEMNLFQPTVYPSQLAKSALWRARFQPLVDPELIEREKRNADLQQEKRDFAAIKARGIKRDRFGQWSDDVFGMTDWDCHPDGKSQFLCAFFTRIRPIGPTLHSSNLKNDYFEKNRDLLVEGNPRVFFEIYPSHYAINGQPIEPGKPYVQRPDGTVEVLELTPEENAQLTMELFSSSDRFLASDLFLRKISPLIGPPIPKDTPAESAAQ